MEMGHVNSKWALYLLQIPPWKRPSYSSSGGIESINSLKKAKKRPKKKKYSGWEGRD
jgi:hypothetical protein